MLTPLISIVIPSYNGGRYLHDSIQSVLNQDYPNIELLVLDDGSTDDSREILKGYGDRICWESHARMGQANTLNKGWHMSKGEILSYLSVDDVLEEHAVRVSVDYLRRHPEVVLTYCDYYLFDASGTTFRRVETPNFDYMDMVGKLMCHPGPGVFFRRDAFMQAGDWDGSLRQIPDLEYWLRLGLRGSFMRIPQILARFRVHERSLSSSEPTIENADECMHAIRRYFQRDDLPVSVQKLQKSAYSSSCIFAARLHLRAGRYRQAVSRLREAWGLQPRTVMSSRSFRLLANGLKFRILRRLGRSQK